MGKKPKKTKKIASTPSRQLMKGCRSWEVFGVIIKCVHCPLSEEVKEKEE